MRLRIALVALGVALLLTAHPSVTQGANTTYYVSYSTGLDTNNGLSSGAPFKTITKVNSLSLQQGDKVLFKCGDTWRMDMLRIKWSGASGSPITFGSYPSDCLNKPILSGSQPITGWSVFSGNIYAADVPAGTFPGGINQLFRNGQRLAVGRWPNLDQLDGGYATINSQTGPQSITSGQLPLLNWNNANVHVRAMTWIITNRFVTSTSGNTLNLNANPQCWESNCSGWGFWISNSVNALDRDGEWAYDAGSRKVYLYSTAGNPGSTIEASVVQSTSDYAGGIILGDATRGQSHIVIENFEIKNWFDNGITTPVNAQSFNADDIIIRNNTIRDVNKIGINLRPAVWGSGPYGFRAGSNYQITGNTTDGANQMGMYLAISQSTVEQNTIKNISLLTNLGPTGMGCSNIDYCPADGQGIIVYSDGPLTGNNVTVRYNRFENIGYNGVQFWGADNLFEYNFLSSVCATKSDCGAVYTWGAAPWTSSPMRNLTIRNNIVVNTVGPEAGTKSPYRRLYGFGIYVDNYSNNITSTGNTIAGSTAPGILYQNSSGTITNNTLYNNASGDAWLEQVAIWTPPQPIAAHTGNIMLALNPQAGNVRADGPSSFAVSNFNKYYHSNRYDYFRAPGRMTLDTWRGTSGQDWNSTGSVSSVYNGTEIFYNDTLSPKVFCFSQNYTDLNGTPVSSPMTLQPFTSRILIGSGGTVGGGMSISKSALGGVMSGMQFTYTLTVNNYGPTATNLIVTDTLPSNLTYVSGGTRNGNTVSWGPTTLPACSSTQFTFRASPGTGATIVYNTDYRANADGGISISGPPMMTIVNPKQFYLPMARH